MISLWETLRDSRKWKIGLGALAIALFGENAGLTPEQTETAAQALMAIVIGQGLSDSAKPKAG